MRLADACDNGRRRLVESVLTAPQPGRIEVTLLTNGPAELETWTPQKCQPAFRKAFARKLEIQTQTVKAERI